MMETITGTIESNNGTEALVCFADGAEKLLKLSGLHLIYPRGKACSPPCKSYFGDRGITYSVSMFERDNTALLGTSLNVSGLAVFCAPVFESPDGGDEQYFALGRGEQWEWLAVT